MTEEMIVLDNIQKQVGRLVNHFDYDRKTRQEFKMQYADHINNLKSEYIENEIDDGSALKKALSDFQNGERMQLKQNIYVNSVLKKIMVGFLILSVLLIAICFLNPMTNEGQAAKTARSVGYMYSIKLVPFRTIGLMFTKNSPYVYWYLYILLFVPLGIFMPFGINRYFNNVLIFKYYLLSVIAVQVIRIVFPVGIVNIDILLLNLVGCIVGFTIYKYVILKIAIKNRLIYNE
jgi:glycopeptide antibiotics resistance protein